MIVLGLLLILVAVGATVFAVMAPSATSATIVVTALGVKVSASPLAMFLAGAASLLLLALGYVLISRGTRRSARSRRELRQLRKEQAASGASAAAEGGHRSNRHDRHQKDNRGSDANQTNASASEGTDASSDSARNAGATTDTGKAVESDRHQESEPPTPS